MFPYARLLLLIITPRFTYCLSGSSPPHPPPPPWSFTAARIHYQFLTIPADAAGRAVPTESAGGNKIDDKGDGLTLLSVGGQTLGGLFAIEYVDSPIGPYKEVAVLAGLVTKGYDIFRIGAWASHIFVDKPEAAEYGKRYWGLPATVVPIDLDMSPPPNPDDTGDGNPFFVFSKDSVGVACWTGSSPTTKSVDNEPTRHSLINKLDVTLPSYSGKLAINDPLLRYPLTISDLGVTSTGKARAAQFQREIHDYDYDETLRTLLANAKPLVSVDVSGATLVAGVPKVI